VGRVVVACSLSRVISPLMLMCIIFDASSNHENDRTTITVDDELYRQTLELAEPGIEKADLIREAMRVFVRVQSGKRLAALGGKSPKMTNIPRRRPA
jgi:Arc/MetJ family transcription regulator